MIGGMEYTVLDSLYMTIITISTIGYGEIIDLSGSPAGRVFTIFIAFSGIGVLTYILLNVTAFIIEGELNEAFRRKKMENVIKKFKGHYIVCGIGRVGFYIVDELHKTKRTHVIIDTERGKMEKALEEFQEKVFIEGDATDNNTLLKAGIKEAGGLFAVTGDDNRNLVISLTAKQLNPGVKVVARCNELTNIEKMKKAGADAVVSPNFIGGLRIASEMIRPTVVSFLDRMLRDKDKNLRIEEVAVPDTYSGKPISSLNLGRHRHVLLLAVKTGEDWVYNPPENYTMQPGNTLIFMTTPGERIEVEKLFCN